MFHDAILKFTKLLYHHNHPLNAPPWVCRILAILPKDQEHRKFQPTKFSLLNKIRFNETTAFAGILKSFSFIHFLKFPLTIFQFICPFHSYSTNGRNKQSFCHSAATLRTFFSFF